MTPDSSTGTASELRAFIGSLFHHMMGLASLAGWEGREASTRYFRLMLTLMGTLFFLGTGYLFLLIFSVMFFYHRLKVDWMWIALGLAAFHGIIAMMGMWIFNRNIGKPLFASTFSEIRRDIETLAPSPLPRPQAPANYEPTTYQASSFSRN